MLEITEMLSGAYRFLDFSNEATFGIWYETLKNYEAGEVRQAVKNWAAYSAHEPTPADILDATKNVRTARRENAMDYVDWRSVKTVQCRECNDHGYVTVVYPTGYEELRPCGCAAGHRNFPWLFSEEFERKAKWITSHEDPEQTAKYLYGMNAEDAKKARFKEIRHVTMSGRVLLRKEATR